MFKKKKFLIGLVTLLAITTVCMNNSFAQEDKSGWDYLQNNQQKNTLNQQLPDKTKQVTKRIYKEGDLKDGVLKIRGSLDIFPDDETISLKLRNTDVRAILEELASKGRKNIIVDNSVKGTITADLQDVSINKALDLVLAAGELEARIIDDNLFVAARTAMLRKGLNRRVVKSIKLNHAYCVDVASVLNASIFNTGVETKVEKTLTESAAETAMQATEIADTSGPTLGPPPGAETTAPMADPAAGTTVAQAGTEKYGAERDVRVVDYKIDKGGNYNDANKLAGSIKLEGLTGSFANQKVPDNNGGTIVIPDSRTNSLLIAGIEEDIYTAEKTIEYLDKPLKQVSIEVSLIEMNRTDAENLGLVLTSDASMVSAGFNNTEQNFQVPTTFTPNGWVSADNNYAAGRNSIAGLSQTVGMVTQAGQGILQFSTVRNITQNIAFKINAMIEKNKVKVISNPNIIALNNTESLIKLTEQIINRVRNTYNSTTGALVSSEPILEDVGMVLYIKPQVGDDGYVNLRIRPSLTAPGGTQQLPDQSTITLIRTREVLIQNVRVKTGETLAIGGLINTRETNRKFKIPFLGDLPILGGFFRTTAIEKEKTELIILVTPKIINDIAMQASPLQAPIN